MNNTTHGIIIFSKNRKNMIEGYRESGANANSDGRGKRWK